MRNKNEGEELSGFSDSNLFKMMTFDVDFEIPPKEELIIEVTIGEIKKNYLNESDFEDIL